jgi:hypothetical protein
MQWQTFARFKPSFAVSFVLAWNGMMIVGIWLNGGMGRIHSPAALVVVGLAALSIPCILFAAATHDFFRQLVFRPKTNLAEIGSDLLILGSIGGLLGIGALASAALSNAP